MDVRTLLRRRAARRPRVFPVALPGATAVRLAAEAELRRRGLTATVTPADADLLVVCGVPAAGDLDWLDRIAAAMPRPAARIVVPSADRAAQLLDTGRALLEAGPAYRHPPETAAPAASGAAGLSTAQRGDDRDGLRLDRLHLVLGPALADWPAGLLLRLTLQGDIVQAVRADTACATDRPALPSDRMPFWDEPWLRAAHGDRPVTGGDLARRRCAAHLDSVGRLLAVTGWDDTAARCRRLRDAVLSGLPGGPVRGELLATTRRVARSRTLRWGLAGLGPLPARRARAAGVTGPALTADGDAHDRLLVWLDEIERSAAALDDPRPRPRRRTDTGPAGPRGVLDPDRPPSRALLDVLPELLAGAEFAGARIVVASLDPDLDELAPAPVPAAARG
ncbi:hypothetical protein [Streptomyces poriticola]|uniref:hypothetical protein n=1 Tax=Streptomyces poriticola TaxID=3120506 RepID=UPI002FCE389E